MKCAKLSKVYTNPTSPQVRPSPWLVGSVAVFLLLSLAFLPRALVRKELGQPAPDFTLSTIYNSAEGTKLNLGELHGHVVLLDFWASWCGPCMMQAPIVDRIFRRYHDRGLEVVGIDSNDRPGAGAIAAQKHGMSYPIVYDAVDSASLAYHVDSFPTLVLIGKDGTIKALRSGLVDEGTLDALVNAEL